MNIVSNKYNNVAQFKMSENLWLENAMGESCDIEIVADMDGESVFCHRSVLADKSRYFEAMFSSGMLESTQQTITLGQVYGKDLMAIIKYCYTGELDIEEQMVGGVLRTANMLQLEEVEAECVGFLEQHMTVFNCLELASLAELLSYRKLQEKAEKYIAENFLKVSHSTQFFNLKLKELMQLLSKDELCVETEADIFNSLCQWVKFHPRERYPMFRQLLAVVRRGNLQPAFFTELVRVLGASYSCQQPLIKEAFRVYCLNDQPPQAAKARRWINPNMLALSTVQAENDLIVDHFCGETKTWSSFGRIPLKRDTFGAAILGDKLYVVGGFNDELTINWELTTVESFDLSTKVTTKLRPLSMPRSNLGVVALGGSVYAIGGSCGGSILSSAERYDPSAQSWSAISSMPTPRYGGGYAVLGDVIYALGGIDNGGKYRNTLEAYDPATDRWTRRANMVESRAHCKVITDHDFIYVVGGHGNNGVVRDQIDRYNPATDTWTQIAPLKNAATYNFAFVGIELMAFKSEQNIDDEWQGIIATYDKESNTWSQKRVATSLRDKVVRSAVPIKTKF